MQPYPEESDEDSRGFTPPGLCGAHFVDYNAHSVNVGGSIDSL